MVCVVVSRGERDGNYLLLQSPSDLFFDKTIGEFLFIIKLFWLYSLIQLNFANFYGTFRPNFSISQDFPFSPPPALVRTFKKRPPVHDAWAVGHL